MKFIYNVYLIQYLKEERKKIFLTIFDFLITC